MTQTLTFVAPFVPNDENMQQLTCKALRTFVCLLPFVPLGMVSGNFFQGTGKAWRSMFLNACRQIILLIPFLLIMPRFFGLRGVFMAQPIADIGTAFIALFMLRLELKKIPRE